MTLIHLQYTAGFDSVVTWSVLRAVIEEEMAAADTLWENVCVDGC